MKDDPDTMGFPVGQKDTTQAMILELREVLARAQVLLEELSTGNGSARQEPDKHGSHQRQVQTGKQNPVLEEFPRRATFGDVHVYLGRYEMGLLRILLSEYRVFSIEEMLKRLYPVGDKPEIHIINVYLSYLRKKLKAICGGKDPIETVRGKGFVLHREILPK